MAGTYPTSTEIYSTGGADIWGDLRDVERNIEKNIDLILTDAEWMRSSWLVVIRTSQDDKGAFKDFKQDDDDLRTNYTSNGYNVIVAVVSDMDNALQAVESLSEFYNRVNAMTGSNYTMMFKHIIIAGHANSLGVHFTNGYFKLDDGGADGAADGADGGNSGNVIDPDIIAAVANAIVLGIENMKIANKDEYDHTRPMHVPTMPITQTIQNTPVVPLASAASAVSAVSAASTVSAANTINTASAAAATSRVLSKDPSVLYTRLFLDYCRERMCQSDDSYSTIFLHGCGVGEGENDLGTLTAKYMSSGCTIRVYAPVDAVETNTLCITDVDSLSIQSHLMIKEIVATNGRIILNTSNMETFM